MARKNFTIPSPAFCWTRFGVEAGQDVSTILARKEIERRDNGGVFLWGIGNSILPSVPLLLQTSDVPKAVFSPIRSRPRDIDSASSAVAVWTRARTYENAACSLPAHSLVTSHAGRAKGRHYALVCRSDHPLCLNDNGPTFRMSELTNLRSDRPVGASQVTAIVRHRAARDSSGPEYRAAMTINLVAPYVIALEAPVVIQTEGLDESDALIAVKAARDLAERVASDSDFDQRRYAQQYNLFA